MFAYYINVPLNENGIAELESYDKDMKNVRTFELTESEYECLRKKNGVFEQFDSKFGTIIDVCEEERIDISNIDSALEISRVFKSKGRKNSENSAAYTKLIESLETAKCAGTFWEIDIYLE
jgi:hypothetical protein